MVMESKLSPEKAKRGGARGSGASQSGKLPV
jgi:hypothetical protein